MVSLSILGLGITALLQTLNGGIMYAKDTENNIKAINIAREGIEAVTNIRDTNWIRFSSDKTNCWKVDKYNPSCIGNTSGNAGPVIATGSYTVYASNGVWFLSGVASTAPIYTTWNTYQPIYKVGLDTNGFYTQTGIVATKCDAWTQSGCTTGFTREIQINYPQTETGSMTVRSITRWFDRRPQSVILDTTLTNWKSNF